MDVVPFLPFGPVTIIREIPKGYEQNPTTLGGHLKKRRLESNLMKKEAAALLLVNEWTYLNWEKDQKTPMITLFGRVIEWLGYDPYPVPTTAGEEIISKRRRAGISRKRLAKEMGIDESTLEKIEKSQIVLKPYVVRLMARLLAASRSFHPREQSQTICSLPGSS